MPQQQGRARPIFSYRDLLSPNDGTLGTKMCAFDPNFFIFTESARARAIRWGKTFRRIGCFFFFYENDRNSETKSPKSFRGLEMKRLFEGYKRTGRMAKNGSLGQNPSFLVKPDPKPYSSWPGDRVDQG